MVAARNQHYIAVIGGEYLVQIPVRRVDALKGKALDRVQLIVVDLFQVRLPGRFFRIMFVWRETGPIPSRGIYLSQKKTGRRFTVR